MSEEGFLLSLVLLTDELFMQSETDIIRGDPVKQHLLVLFILLIFLHLADDIPEAIGNDGSYVFQFE